MDLTSFIQQRRPDWRRLEDLLRRVEGSGLRALDNAEAVEFGRLYRRSASDLNQAQTFVSGDSTVAYLNDLVARSYLVIYGRSKTDVRALLRHLFWGYPAVFRRYSRHVLLAVAIFLAGAVFGYVALYFDSDVAKAFLLPNTASMIRPGEEEDADLTPPMSSGQIGLMTSFYFANNTSVCLITFALGMTFGVGTAYLLFTNGILLGGLAVIFVRAGQFTSFCAEVLPHGMVEIPAVFISGGAGFLLAQGMLRARPWPRLQELARTGKEALLLVSGCVPLLAAAAILEAGVARAPQGFLTNAFKLAVAAVVALLFATYVLLLGWRKPGQQKGTGLLESQAPSSFVDSGSVEAADAPA
jgi:uncharacterized membrane protein SpoIIM required for sporulation